MKNVIWGRLMGLFLALMAVALMPLATPALAANIPPDAVITCFEDVVGPGSDMDFQDGCIWMTGAKPIGPGTQMVAPGNNGAMPFSNQSYDCPGEECNAGSLVTGTGYFTGDPASPNWNFLFTLYWMDAWFEATSVTGEVFFEWSAYSAISSIFYTDNSGAHLIAPGPAGPGTGFAFVPNGPFQPRLSSPAGLDKSASFMPVPEPGSLGLIGVGLVLLGVMRPKTRRI